MSLPISLRSVLSHREWLNLVTLTTYSMIALIALFKLIVEQGYGPALL